MRDSANEYRVIPLRRAFVYYALLVLLVGGFVWIAEKFAMENRALFLFVIWSAPLTLLLLGVFLVRHGKSAIRSRKFPPPGSLVIPSTRIYQGRNGVYAGWVTAICGAVLILLATSWAYLNITIAPWQAVEVRRGYQ